MWSSSSLIGDTEHYCKLWNFMLALKLCPVNYNAPKKIDALIISELMGSSRNKVSRQKGFSLGAPSTPLKIWSYYFPPGNFNIFFGCSMDIFWNSAMIKMKFASKRDILYALSHFPQQECTMCQKNSLEIHLLPIPNAVFYNKIWNPLYQVFH